MQVALFAYHRNQHTMIQYLPFLSSAFALFFLIQLLYDYFKTERVNVHYAWWAMGVFCFGLGTFLTGYCDKFGYNEMPAKLSYIMGPLLSAFPFAQGFVYLLTNRKFANGSTIVMLTIIAALIVAIVLSPFAYKQNEEERIIGVAFQWQWIRWVTSIINVWSLVFFFGGALYAAFKTTERNFGDARFNGYLSMAAGAFLPALDGYLAHAGYDILLSVFEFVGILLIYTGYVGLNMDKVS